jgi:hypothetical protein
MASVIIAPDLYSNPAKSAIPGSRRDFRSYSWAAAYQTVGYIIALGILPAYHRLSALELECSDMDSGSSHTLSVGLLNSYYNRPVASSAAPGWDLHTGTPGIPIQTGSTTGATTPGESDGLGGTTPILALGCNIITSSNIPQAGGRASMATNLTPMLTLGVSQFDRIIGLQLTAVGTAVAGYVGMVYALDFD